MSAEKDLMILFRVFVEKLHELEEGEEVFIRARREDKGIRLEVGGGKEVR